MGVMINDFSRYAKKTETRISSLCHIVAAIDHSVTSRTDYSPTVPLIDHVVSRRDFSLREAHSICKYVRLVPIVTHFNDVASWCGRCRGKAMQARTQATGRQYISITSHSRHSTNHIYTLPTN